MSNAAATKKAVQSLVTQTRNADLSDAAFEAALTDTAWYYAAAPEEVRAAFEALAADEFLGASPKASERGAAWA